jgi:hypothetical protein
MRCWFELQPNATIELEQPLFSKAGFRSLADKQNTFLQVGRDLKTVFAELDFVFQMARQVFGGLPRSF